jgi:hypothetical protein
MKRKQRLLAIGAVAVLFLMILAAACAPRQSAPSDTGADGQVDSGIEGLNAPAWSTASDCASCHVSNQESRESSQMLAAQPTHASSNCVVCHDDEAKLKLAHANATSAPAAEIQKLRKSTVSSESCLSCHESPEELAAATVSSTALTDKNGLTVNPHQLPENEDHAGINCGNCHVMHKESVLDDASKKFCLSCHHQDVFVGCTTCHGVE